MNRTITGALCLLAATAFGLSADSLSFTGTLNSPEDVFETTFTLTAADTVTFETWGFGGGTNAQGQVIAGGGFDPLIALFNGPIATATMSVDGSGNPLADADNLSNPPWSYVGNCPPAGTVAIGANNDWTTLCKLRWLREPTPWYSPTPITYRAQSSIMGLSPKASWT